MCRMLFGGILLLGFSTLGCGGTQTSQEVGDGASLTMDEVAANMETAASDSSSSIPTKTSSPMPTTNSGSEVQRLEAAISAWKSNRKDEALKYWVTAGSSDQIPAGEELGALRISESDVNNLSQAERNAFQADVIKIAPVVRDLGSKCISDGSALLERKNASEAKKYFEAAKRLGQVLAAPQRVKALHSLGTRLINEGEQGILKCAENE